MQQTPMDNGAAAAAPRGRPQSQQVRANVLQAALALIGERGVDGVTFEAIAARAGTTRPALYRRWPKKEALLAEALELHRPQLTVPDTGSLRTDLAQVAADFMRHYSTPVARQAVLAILGAATTHKGTGRAWAAAYGAPRIDSFRVLFSRAMARGELPADADIDTMMFILSSALLQACLLSGMQPHIVGHDVTDRVITFILK